MNKKLLILIVATVVVAIGGGYAWNEYTRTSATADELPVKETTTATELLAAFTADEASATTRYVGTTEQVVQVSGTIRSVDVAANGITNVVLETGDALAGVVCEFATDKVPAAWKAGASVTVKGICTGMLMDVILVRCAAVE